MTLDDQHAFVEEFLLATYKPTTVRARSPERTECEHVYDIWTALQHLGSLCEFPDDICDENATRALAACHFTVPAHDKEGCLFLCKSILSDEPEPLSEHCETYYRLWKLRVLEEVLKNP